MLLQAPNTYKHWLLSRQLEVAKAVVKDWHDAKEKADRKQGQRDKSWEKREEEKRELRESYEELRREAVSRGAKTFKELHPKIDDDNKNNSHGNHSRQHKERHRHEAKPFKVRVTFQMADLTDKKREAYFELYEAVWEGDIAKVKELSMKSNGDREPLQLAVQDNRGFSPFAIAVLRGHSQLAKLILEIAQAQYQPPNQNKPSKRYVLRTAGADSDEESEYDNQDDDDEVSISSELVDDTFTIENIADLTQTVGSKISVSTMLSWQAPTWLYSDKPVTKAKEEMGGNWRSEVNVHGHDAKVGLQILSILFITYRL